MTLKLAPGVEIAALKRRIAKLESDLAYLQQFRHEDLMRVYRAAMRWYKADAAHDLTNVILNLERACARAAKMAKTGRGGRGK